jgi:Uma2 family endonuclease
MEVLEQIPKTALDVFRLLPEGTLCEVIDNILYMSPAPKYTHQRLIALLYKQIDAFVSARQLGEVFFSPVDVYFESLTSAVQPDLLFISNANKNILHDDGYIYGAPDLVIEVLSSDRKRDLVFKKNLYERAGVKEYFVVDPVIRNMHFFNLENQAYKLKYEEIGVFKSPLLNFHFTF